MIIQPIIIASPPAWSPISEMILSAPPPIIEPMTKPIKEVLPNLFSSILISPNKGGKNLVI